MKRYLTIFIVFIFIFVIRVNAEDYKTGDLIKYKDIKFYVVNDNGDYLTLLKATPLNKNQDNDLMTQDSDEYTIKVQYCKTDNQICDFKESNAKEIIDSWSRKLDDKDLVEADVHYKTKVGEHLYDTTEKYKVRLLTINELVTYLDFNAPGKSCSINCAYNGLKAPKWVYNSNAYWLMDRPIAEEIESSRIEHFYMSGWNGNSEFSGGYNTIGGSNSYALRPVIHLSKKASIVKLKSAVKSIADSEFKIGDIIEYNDMEFYVLKDSSKDDKTITMIKRIPLTLEDITKYKLNNIHLSNSYKRYDESTDLLYNAGFVSYYYREDGCHGWISSSIQEDVTKCKNDYESSDVKQIVDAWVRDNINKSDIVEDELGYKGRLVTLNELINNLGYIQQKDSNYTISEATPFHFSNSWTMTSAKENSKVVDISVQIEESLVYGFREIYPVIAVKKVVKPLDNKVENKVNIPDTLLNNPIFIVVIGIILIVIATITVSLVIKRKK